MHSPLSHSLISTSRKEPKLFTLGRSRPLGEPASALDTLSPLACQPTSLWIQKTKPLACFCSTLCIDFLSFFFCLFVFFFFYFKAALVAYGGSQARGLSRMNYLIWSLGIFGCGFLPELPFHLSSLKPLANALSCYLLFIPVTQRTRISGTQKREQIIYSTSYLGNPQALAKISFSHCMRYGDFNRHQCGRDETIPTYWGERTQSIASSWFPPWHDTCWSP